MKPLGIVANLEKPQVHSVVHKLLGKLAKLRQEVVLEKGLARLLKRKGGVSLQQMGSRCRLLVVLGGDGSVLRVAREIFPHEVPLLPVNFGRLGFLAAVMPEELGKALMIALKNKGKLVPHSTLEVVLARHGKPARRMVALNDAVIARGTVSRVAELELRVDGEYLNTYVCDGMIYSSPTGSTAYSLAAGGPILFPDARAYVITPICPHTLSNRSVIVGGNSVVETRIVRTPKEIFLGLDGQKMIRLNPKDRVLIKMSPYTVKMITMPGSSFFELLRRKLRWAGSSLPS